MDNNKHAHSANDHDRGPHRMIASLLVLLIPISPIAYSEDLYLARAIGEPAPFVRETRTPAGAAIPELPGLGTDTAKSEAAASDGSTWKWVVGIAVTAAVIALAKGGDKSGGDTAPSGGSTGGDASAGNGSGGGSAGGGSSGGGSSGGGRRPRLPELPDFD